METALSIGEALKEGKRLLREKGISSWSLDGDLIMINVSGLSKVELITKSHTLLSHEKKEEFFEYINRRLNLEPIQYIINHAEFMGLDFYVDKNVLIPRGDTECVIQPAIEYINENKCEKILDLCSGSGAIAISIAVYCKDTKAIWASDISSEALEIVRENSKLNKADNKIKTIQSDMFDKIEDCFDIIISNPPYIEKEEINKLLPNVKDYEPKIALDGGLDGLDFYRIIASEAKKRLKDNGRVYLEIGSLQKEEVKKIFSSYTYICAVKDLYGLDRGLVFRK
jgi:release factor glutamine methyltransferase